MLLKMKDETLDPYPLTVGEVTGAISALRAEVGGGNDSPLYTDELASIIVPADKNGLAYARSVEQVLAIVYLGNAKKVGGFFTNGVNLTKLAK